MKKIAFSHFKTRQQIADEYQLSYSTFWRKLKATKIKLPNGLLPPALQKAIYDTFGYPKGVTPSDYLEKRPNSFI